MDCRTVQEEILECVDQSALSVGARAHVSACQACAAFAAAQADVDARLSRALVPPRLSSNFRGALHSRIAAERRTWVRDAAPDMLHFISWGVLTVATALFLSVDPLFVFVGGATTALSTYVVLSAVRSSFEEA
jgi:hypothetical protein